MVDDEGSSSPSGLSFEGSAFRCLLAVHIVDEIETNGRATTSLLATIIEKNQPYISQRVTRLREHGIEVNLYDTPEQAANYLPDDESGDEE